MSAAVTALALLNRISAPAFASFRAFSTMSEELFDVLDEQGHKTGEVKARSAVHRDGDYHRYALWVIIALVGHCRPCSTKSCENSHAGSECA